MEPLKYTFRKVKIEEKEKALELYHSIIGTKGCTWNMYYPSIDNVYEDIQRGSLFCLSSKTDTIIAIASACNTPEHNCLDVWKEPLSNPGSLSRIGVHPNYQGKGYGKLILSLVIDESIKNGFDGIRMLVSKTNYYAINLYKQFGFSCCGETNEYDIDFFCYELNFKKYKKIFYNF